MSERWINRAALIADRFSMTQLEATAVCLPESQGRREGEVVESSAGVFAVAGHAVQERYLVATEKAKAFRTGGGQDCREVVNPDGIWHAVDAITGELMCRFGGVVYRWKGYDFAASRFATRCADCVEAIKQR